MMSWQKYAIVGSSAFLLAACVPGMNQEATPTPTMMPSASPDSMMEGAGGTNDIIVDVNEDGRPEGALAEGDVSMRDGESDVMSKEDGSMVVTLNTQNDSGQQGTATLTEAAGKVKVVLNLSGGTYTAPQPAHIHVGSCPTPGAVKYPLTNVSKGRSETMLNVTMKALMESSDKLSINVHKSAAESSVYTACGNLK